VASTPQSWLDQMFEPCGVYHPVREHGVIVDFERVYLNAAGRVLLLTLSGDASITSMLEEAPNVVESGLFEKYVGVAESGIPWTGLSQPYADDKRSIVLDLQVWRVPEGIAITYRDVSERERLTHELTRSEELFRTMVDHLPDAVSVLRAVREGGDIVDFEWIYANADGAALLGHPVERLLGSRVLDLFPEQRGIGLIERYAQVVETGEDWRQPTVWIEDTWGDGTHRRRAFDIHIAKVGDGFVVVYREVTAVREALEELDRVGGDIHDPAASAVDERLVQAVRDQAGDDPFGRPPT
jgi:PAS domain-containing protein